MQMCCFKTAGTLSKAEKIDKFLQGVSRPASTFLIIFYANLAAAAAIPVTLTWFQPQGRFNKYVVEISDDAKFGTTNAKTDVVGNTFLWQAPKEGVYHWRVAPAERLNTADTKNQTVETSSVASGSFFVLDAGAESGEPVAVRWSDDPSVTAYHLRIQEDGRDARVAISLVPTYNFVRGAKAIAVQIIPRGKSSSSKIAKDAVARFDPNLEIVVKAPEPKVVPPPPARELVVGNEPIPQDQPHLYEALPAAPAPVVFNEQPREEMLLPENHVLELLVAGYYGTEKTYSARGPLTTRQERGNAAGGMLSYRAVPISGLHLQANGALHGRNVTWRDQDRLNTVSQQTSSYFGEVGVGWDLFFRNPNRRHQLVLDIRGAMTSIYDMAYETNDFASENLKRLDLQLWGGGLWYRWTAKRWGLGGHLASMVQTVNRSHDNDSGLNEWSVFASFDPRAYVTISMGAMSRLTVARRCSSDAAICSVMGASAARNNIVASYLGVGYVVY